MEEKTGRFPTLHIVGESIPEAYYEAIRSVWENGARVRTEYDRKDKEGNFLDPPSRDARVLIEVLDPFKEPRFPPISFCEIGKYISEMMGVKDHLVVPIRTIKDEIKQGGVSSTKWPYTYHQRLFSYPTLEGETIDQVETMIEKIVETFYTRRAVAQTGVPVIDPFMKEDLPCLREIQIRGLEDSEGVLRLNMTSDWRSRDLYKAWGDNVIAVTYLQKRFCEELTQRMGRLVKPGSYADFSYSLHIYGQDFSQVGGDSSKGMRSFAEKFPDKEAFIEKSMTSEDAREMLVIPQLEQLVNEEIWNFPGDTEKVILKEISDFKSGKDFP